MSSLFSDPPFARGTSLLNKEAIELDTNGFPVAGREIAGAVKAFPDVTPGTGPASVRQSNRLVYCMACRYVGTSALNPADNGADKGKFFVIDRSSPLGAQFTTVAAAADTAAGRIVGVLDEYLTTEVRTNDIVWLVVGGPTSAVKAANAVLSNVGVEVSSGSAVTLSTQANRVGAIADPSGTVTASANGSGTGTATTVAISTTVANLALLAVGNHISGTNVPTGATISSVASLSISGTTVTAVLGVNGNVTPTAIQSAAVITITNQSYAGTACRVTVDCNLI